MGRDASNPKNSRRVAWLMRDRATTVVIGAGIIGASIAYNLARRGAKNVVVVDESRAGSGSTAASLGGFRTSFPTKLTGRLGFGALEAKKRLKNSKAFNPWGGPNANSSSGR